MLLVYNLPDIAAVFVFNHNKWSNSEIVWRRICLTLTVVRTKNSFMTNFVWLNFFSRKSTGRFSWWILPRNGLAVQSRCQRSHLNHQFLNKSLSFLKLLDQCRTQSWICVWHLHEVFESHNRSMCQKLCLRCWAVFCIKFKITEFVIRLYLKKKILLWQFINVQQHQQKVCGYAFFVVLGMEMKMTHYSMKIGYRVHRVGLLVDIMKNVRKKLASWMTMDVSLVNGVWTKRLI